MFKIIEKNRCFYVMIEKRVLFRRKYVPFITYRGSKDAYPHSSYKSAERNLINKIRDLINN